MSQPSLYLLLADAVLILHFAIVVFVVKGLVLIVVGNLRHWAWVNTWWFRLAHLATIAVVVAQSWLGMVCPLTTLEMWLRAQAGAASYQGSFIAHWFGRILFYQAPPWVFVLVYSVFGLLVMVAWWYFPVRCPLMRRRTHRV